MKFKVGDRVKCIMPKTIHENIGGSGWKLGLEFTIDEITSSKSKEPIAWGKESYQGAGVYFSALIKAEVINMKNAKFGVQYVRGEDPVEFFKTKKEAQKRIEELLDDSEVDKTSIFLFEIGKVYEVKRPINFELVQV